MIEESGAGSGSRMPKNMWIRITDSDPDPQHCFKESFCVHFRVPHLQAGDAADPEACFAALPALCAKQLVHEDPSLVADLLGVMLYAENRCDTAQWFSLR